MRSFYVERPRTVLGGGDGGDCSRRRTDTNTVGTQSRCNAAAPRHPTRPKSTGRAPARPGTAWLPWRPCTSPHSRASTGPTIASQQAQRTHRPTTPTSTDKRGLPTHVQACCNGLRGAAARRARGASAPSRSDPNSPPSRTLQADLPAAELEAPRPARRGW